MADLDGRIALVTGASRGLGAATARALTAAGAKVIATDIADTAELAGELGGFSMRHDVTSEEDWMAVMRFAEEKAGGLDILVNNAGLFFLKPITEMTLEEWRRIHAVNVDGVFLGVKHAVPLLAARAHKWKGGASIINLSSVAGLRGSAMASSYNSTKGAVRLFTKGAALELASQRIRVNSIHPGIIQTDMADDLVTRYSDHTGVGDNDMRSQLSARHALGHFGEAGNIADAAVFLASDKAAFMTGSEVVVDGGFSCH